MSHRFNIRCLLTATLIAGMGAAPAIAADYPPKIPDAPVLTIPKDFKESAPEKKLVTFFNSTLTEIKPNQLVKPEVGGLPKNEKASETIKLPNGLIEHLPALKTDKNGNVQLPKFYFTVKGTYVMEVKVGKKIKKITFVVK